MYRTVALRNEEEHYLIRSVLNDMLYKRLDYEHWSAKLHVFRRLFRGHVGSEEDTTFSVIADNFTQEEVSELERKYMKTRAELTGDGAGMGPHVHM